MAVEEVRWDKGSMVRAGDYFFYGEGNQNDQLGTGFFVHKRIVSSLKRLELISYRMTYTVLPVCWCNIIVLNAYVPMIQKTVFMRN